LKLRLIEVCVTQSCHCVIIMVIDNTDLHDCMINISTASSILFSCLNETKRGTNRKLNIILTQLRNSYSFLNYDLSKVDIVNDAACSCGAPREDTYHYFFTCPSYTEIRLTMMKNLNWVQTIDLNLLTCGSDDLTYEENINIIKHVFNFIKSSERFLVV
jgi:hypothetical protein